MSKKSRNKGARQERALAKAFSDWWGSEFTRTPMSGGFSTRTFREDWNAAGDLVTPDPAFPFCVESKNVEGWHLEQLITSDKGLFYSWWGQTIDESPSDKIPLLVFTRNHQPNYFAIKKNDFSFTTWTRKYPHFVVKSNNYKYTVVVGLLDDFFQIGKDKWINKKA